MEVEDEVPDHFRCRRTDGRQWRCSGRALPNVSFCEVHQIQARRRQNKLGVPDSLKLKRRPRRPSSDKPQPSDRVPKKRKVGEKGGGNEGKKEKRRKTNGGLLVELMRVVLRRKVEKRDKKEKTRRDAPEVLPVLALPVVEVAKKPQKRLKGKSSVIVPDHLRCRRNDGKQWRCSRPAMEKHCFCELHHMQAFRRQYKLGVPDTLKLRPGRHPSNAQIQPLDDVVVPKEGMKRKKEDNEEEEEDMRRATKKEKRGKKIEGLLVDMVRMVLQSQMKRREEKEERRRKEAPVAEVRRNLPNGLMAISSVASVESPDNVGGHLDRKLGLDSSTFLRWCFRSKNVEPPPVGTLQMFPYDRKGVGLGKREQRICHHCRNSNICRTIRCSSCREFFCKSCIKKWYSELSVSDVMTACPICCGNCCCAACLPGRPSEQQTDLHSVKVG